MNDLLKTDAWDQSYDKGDNYVFYPHEEVIRFVSRYVRKRTGFDSFSDRRPFARTPTGLDLGCGIGRHVRYMDDMQIEAHGIDLSRVAIEEALRVCQADGRSQLHDRFHIGSITEMPYEDGYFDCIVSHGVLDSMPFDIARQAVVESRRVLDAQGHFYLDLISGDDPEHFPEYAGEETVVGPFESDTIQSYFNFARIQQLIGDTFSLVECQLIRHSNMIGSGWHSRYHLVLGA
jgi:SAM-dependent methyltransferase